jgi:hypothetical protein
MTALRGEDAIGRPKHSMTPHRPAGKTHEERSGCSAVGVVSKRATRPLRKPSEPLVASSLAK